MGALFNRQLNHMGGTMLAFFSSCTGRFFCSKGQGRFFLGHVPQHGDQHGVLEHIGMVAGVESVAVTEHPAMVPAGHLGLAVTHHRRPAVPVPGPVMAQFETRFVTDPDLTRSPHG